MLKNTDNADTGRTQRRHPAKAAADCHVHINSANNSRCAMRRVLLKCGRAGPNMCKMWEKMRELSSQQIETSMRQTTADNERTTTQGWQLLPTCGFNHG